MATKAELAKQNKKLKKQIRTAKHDAIKDASRRLHEAAFLAEDPIVGNVMNSIVLLLDMFADEIKEEHESKIVQPEHRPNRTER